MLAARIKKTRTPESVPCEGHPDRKRVLNVLAQRRYRQRRKEKIAALEAQTSDPLLAQCNQEVIKSNIGEPCIDPGRLKTTNIETDLGKADTSYMVARSPSKDSSPWLNFDHDPFEMNFMQEHNLLDLPTPLPVTPESPSTQFPLTPDGALLDIPILNALRAFSSIALAFGVTTHVWDPSYLHVVAPQSAAVAALPGNLQPVAAQFMIPHHPMLDLLPWPTVREKLICMFSMPSSFRPEVAQEDCCDPPVIRGDSSFGNEIKQSKAIVRLVYDLEGVQGGEGLRVHGNTTTWGEGNELIEDAWEIGDVFYKKWWWCLDERIVEASNRRRRERGLPRLKMIG